MCKFFDFLFADFLAHDFGEGNVCTPVPEDFERIREICLALHRVSAKGGDKQTEFHLAVQMLYYIRRNLSGNGQSEVLPDLLQSIQQSVVFYRQIFYQRKHSVQNVP